MYTYHSSLIHFYLRLSLFLPLCTSRFRKAISRSAGQEIPCSLWNPEAHIRQKVPPLDSVGTNSHPHIIFHEVYLLLDLSSELFPSQYPATNLYTHIMSPYACYIPHQYHHHQPGDIWWNVQVIKLSNISCFYLPAIHVKFPLSLLRRRIGEWR